MEPVVLQFEADVELCRLHVPFRTIVGEILSHLHYSYECHLTYSSRLIFGVDRFGAMQDAFLNFHLGKQSQLTFFKFHQALKTRNLLLHVLELDMRKNQFVCKDI